MKFLKGCAAVLCGLVGGAVVWVISEVIVHGVCSVPVLRFFWCTVGPGESIGDSMGFIDFLGLPLFMGIGVAGLWKVWVRGEPFD